MEAEALSPESAELLKELLNFPVILWNAVMELVGFLSHRTPQDFSHEAWAYVTGDLMNITLTIGGSLFASFYLINMLRQTSNLKQGITMEKMIESFIGVILCNYAMVYGVEVMALIFRITGFSAGLILNQKGITFEQFDMDLGAYLFLFVCGLLYFAVALVCSLTILYVVYRRYLQLYALVAVGPIAWSTIPGGHGISGTAVAWFKSFLGKSGEIVLIAVYITIASKMCNSINVFMADTEIGALFDGALQSFQNMITMILVAGATSGAEMTLRRWFNL